MAEQTPAGRTLNYNLGEDTLDRVKGASIATAGVENQKLQGKTELIDTGVALTRQIGGAIEKGKAITKKLENDWDTVEARGNVFGTTEAMTSFKGEMKILQEKYMKAVRGGNKEEQEKYMGQLNDNVTQLENTKVAVEGLASDKTSIGHKKNPDSFSTANQQATAALALNTEVASVYIEGQGMLSEIATDEGVKIAGDNTVVPPIVGETPEKFEARIKDLIDGNHIGSYVLVDKNGEEVAFDAAKLTHTTEPTQFLKRRFNAAQIEKLGERARKPTAITKSVSDLFDAMQKGGSDPKNPTYFDYESINSSILSGIEPGDIKDFMYENISGSKTTFAEDFEHNPALDIPVLVGFEKYDVNKDGKLSPAERLGDFDGDGATDTGQTPITLTDAHKKLIVKALALPDNAEIAKHHIGDWLTLKAYDKWKEGVKQRQVSTTTGSKGSAVTTSTPANIQFGNKFLADGITPNPEYKPGMNEQSGVSPYGNYYQAGSGVLGQKMAEGTSIGFGSSGVVSESRN